MANQRQASGPAIVEDHTEEACCRLSPEKASQLHGACEDFFFTPCTRGELAQQRKRFLLFLRILTRFLDIKDQDAYNRVRSVFRRFAAAYQHAISPPLPPRSPDRRGNRCPSKPILSDMCTQVRGVVSQAQWESALSLLGSFLEYQRKRRAQQPERGRPGKPALVLPDDG